MAVLVGPETQLVVMVVMVTSGVAIRFQLEGCMIKLGNWTFIVLPK